jgi:hypothetical protein
MRQKTEPWFRRRAEAFLPLARYTYAKIITPSVLLNNRAYAVARLAGDTACGSMILLDRFRF